MENEEKMLTVPEMAEAAGVTREAIHAAIRRGKLKAKKRGRDWFATPGAFNDYCLNSRGKQGRRKQT